MNWRIILSDLVPYIPFRKKTLLCLIDLMKAEPDKEAIYHRWAVSLYKAIVNHERARTDS